MNYKNRGLRAMIAGELTLEEQEELRDWLDDIICEQIDQLPYEPDHHDEHRRTEIRIILDH